MDLQISRFSLWKSVQFREGARRARRRSNPLRQLRSVLLSLPHGQRMGSRRKRWLTWRESSVLTWERLSAASTRQISFSFCGSRKRWAAVLANLFLRQRLGCKPCGQRRATDSASCSAAKNERLGAPSEHRLRDQPAQRVKTEHKLEYVTQHPRPSPLPPVALTRNSSARHYVAAPLRTAGSSASSVQREPVQAQQGRLGAQRPPAAA